MPGHLQRLCLDLCQCCIRWLSTRSGPCSARALTKSCVTLVSIRHGTRATSVNMALVTEFKIFVFFFYKYSGVRGDDGLTFAGSPFCKDLTEGGG